MKKLLLLLVGLLLWFTGSSQPCLPLGITFSTQAQIDSFHANYPNCTQIEGDVTISGANITNLNGLNGLTSIGGNLRICNDSVLPNLSGLGSLTSIAYNLFVGYNPVLTSLTGLEAVTSIGGALEIYSNQALTSLTGLEAVTSIGGALEIYSNQALTSLTGLEAVTSIGGALEIYSNQALTSLTGIDSIDFESITTLGIYHNDSLSNCSVQSICNFLLTGRGVQIYSNKTGCNSPQEVSDNCPYDLNVQNITENNAFSIYPNPATDIITVELSGTTHGGNLTIVDIEGQQVITRQITESKTQMDLSSLPSGVYFVRLIGDRTTAVGKFVKQ